MIHFAKIARQMARIGQIPSDVCPSDHLPLLADFMLTI
jgi:endonuclease/exonuclease/phosphatase (EEP) superfamily protein YafD